MRPNRITQMTLGLSLVLGLAGISPAEPTVKAMAIPDEGIQADAEVDDQGTVHVIYYKGQRKAGNIFYVKREAGAESFSRPMRVNTQPNTAVAAGTVRGPRMALGAEGRVHVAWMGSRKASTEVPDAGHPMLYTRLNDAGTGFEKSRNVMQYAVGLDGGGTVAADAEGNVYVIWHAKGDSPGEANRELYMAASRDHGESFARETSILPKPLGTCGCCAISAQTDAEGNLYVVYRAATNTVNRDNWLLRSDDQGKSFSARRLQRWKLKSCPLSTAALASRDGRVVAAWEKAQRLSMAVGTPADQWEGPYRATGKKNNQTRPTVAIDSQGRMLLAWAEGTGFNKGGSLAWQLYDAQARPTDVRGRIKGGVPVAGRPAAFAAEDDTFVVLH